MSSIKSRTVHARYKDETLLSIIDYYEKFGPSDDSPLTKKVPLVVAACMQSLREEGKLPTYPREEVADRLQAAMDNRVGFDSTPKVEPVDIVIEKFTVTAIICSGAQNLYSCIGASTPKRLLLAILIGAGCSICSSVSSGGS